MFSRKLKRYLDISLETFKALYINEFVCLSSKVYAYRTDTEYDKKLKGIKKNVDQRKLILNKIIIVHLIKNIQKKLVKLFYDQ